jgi:hypothetical protein
MITETKKHLDYVEKPKKVKQTDKLDPQPY